MLGYLCFYQFFHWYVFIKIEQEARKLSEMRKIAMSLNKQDKFQTLEKDKKILQLRTAREYS